MTLSSVFLCLSLAAFAQQGSPSSSGTGPDASAKPQTPESNATEQEQKDASGELPVSLKRIQRALAEPQPLKVLQPTMRDGRPVFRVDIEGEKIDVQSILGRDFLRGAASYGGMTHQEFLDLVTPDDVKGYAAFSNGQGMTVAATSIALQWAVLKALDTFKKAKDNHAREEARKEVSEALDALRKARKAAGLPDK